MVPFLTPGVRFIARIALYSSLYILAFVTLAKPLIIHLNSLHHRDIPLELPTWLLILLSLLAIILFAACRIHIRNFTHARAAAGMGARLAERYRGRWFLNLDLLVRMQRNSRNGYPTQTLMELTEEYGEVFDCGIGGEMMLFTTSPKHVQAILATQFDKFDKGPTFRAVTRSVLGSGIFNVDGDMWKFHRSLTRPFFTRDRVTHFALFDEHARSAIALMKKRLREGVPIDFHDLALRFTMDTASQFLFASCVDSLRASLLPYPHNHPKFADTPPDDFSRAFLEALTVLAQRERMSGFAPLLEIREDAMDKSMRTVNAFIEPIVRMAMDRKVRDRDIDALKPKGDINGGEIGDDDTLLDHLVRNTDDVSIVRDEIMNILLAGRDTTAITLSFIVYFLSMHPDVMKRLRDEVHNSIGKTRTPEIEDIKNMKYMRAVINETLRLFPAVPANIRETTEATTLPPSNSDPRPIYVPAHTQVFYSVMVMQRRKDLWGPDAEEFDPDRFLDERLGKYLVNNPFVFLPFNAGPRICLGQQFAYNELSFVLVRLMQTFRSFTLREDCASVSPPKEWSTTASTVGGRQRVERVFPKVTFTLYMAGGLWIDAEEEEEEEEEESDADAGEQGEI